jgi:uncharacterized membrane protein
MAVPLPVLALTAGTSLVFLGYAWAHWATLKSSAFDLAYFDQVVWNAAQGHGFTSSFAPYPFLGQHFSPALALLVPLYWIQPSPLWLLGAQSAALGLACVPLYRLARTWLDHRSSLIACVAYVGQLFVLRAVGYDFHTEALAVPFIFWAVLGARRADPRGDATLLLAGIAPMLCKEDGALVSLGIGLLAWAVLKRRAGLVLMAVATAYGLVVTTVVMPAIRGGQPGDLIDRYSYLGSSAPGVLIGIVTHPQVALLHLLSPGPLIAVALMLGGVAFLPLARPVAAAAALPALVLALLSQHVQQETLLDQYGLQPGPLIFVAALLGWVRLTSRPPDWWRRFRPSLPAWAPSTGVVLLASTAVALILSGQTPALGSWDRAQAARSLAGAVPAGASVDGSSDLLTLLAEHESIGLLPSHEREWLAVDMSAESDALVSGLPSQGYFLVKRWGALSLWRRQASAGARGGGRAASPPGNNRG